jgi:hypothetical protein
MQHLRIIHLNYFFELFNLMLLLTPINFHLIFLLIPHFTPKII